MNRHRPYGFYERFVKRPLDFFLSLLALILLSPLLLVTALLVRVKLGSPVFYKPERPGRNEKPFRLYKFRSMTDERDEDGRLLPDTERLTRFGRILRALSLDELPELFNILKGDMSIVGPRPLSVKYLPYYTRAEHRRHDVRPGLTGLAQVNGRNAISWDEKFRYDQIYVKKITFAVDAGIVFQTVKKVIARDGIGQGEQHPGNLFDMRRDWLDENGRIRPEYENGPEE
ncbi:MAG: sugar transferase [Clostridia bacterium]|nr:sugar transferase [Clostridia bacterium]